MAERQIWKISFKNNLLRKLKKWITKTECWKTKFVCRQLFQTNSNPCWKVCINQMIDLLTINQKIIRVEVRNEESLGC